MKAPPRRAKGYEVGQRVRILTTCARVLNHGTIVGKSDDAWIVRPDGCGRVRFSTVSLVMLPNRAPFHHFPKIAHA